MSCHGGFALDETTRRSWYSPDAILQDLRPGMVFADIGCGDGFFTILAAKKVGENGKVYAVDVDASAIKKLKSKAEVEGLKNITAKVGSGEETVFCDKCADFVFYSMVLHDFDDPAEVLINAKQMLKADGGLIDLDWKKIEMSFGPPVKIRFSEEHASNLVKNAGFQIGNIKSVGKYHYVVTGRPLP
jgi:ubiquinone/menaquinone biosynthesis C-methylase UbiE